MVKVIGVVYTYTNKFNSLSWYLSSLYVVVDIVTFSLISYTKNSAFLPFVKICYMHHRYIPHMYLYFLRTSRCTVIRTFEVFFLKKVLSLAMRGPSENLQCKNPSFLTKWLDPLDLT